MERKKAMIPLELVGESIGDANRKIAQELLDWLQEDAILIPLVKGVKVVAVTGQ